MQQYGDCVRYGIFDKYTSGTQHTGLEPVQTAWRCECDPSHVTGPCEQWVCEWKREWWRSSWIGILFTSKNERTDEGKILYYKKRIVLRECNNNKNSTSSRCFKWAAIFFPRKLTCLLGVKCQAVLRRAELLEQAQNPWVNGLPHPYARISEHVIGSETSLWARLAVCKLVGRLICLS